MTDRVYQRLALLFGLALLAVGMAFAGNAIGVNTPTTPANTTPEFTVTDNTVLVSDGHQEVTTVANITGVAQVEIEKRSNGFNIKTTNTTENARLNASQRERAKEIALANESVRQYVDSIEGYTIEVQPIQKIDTVAQTIAVNDTTDDSVSVTGNNGSDTIEFTVVETDDADSVAVTRNPTYVADEVNVRITGPDDEPQYSLTINMTTGTIASFTDWDETRNG